MCTRPVLWTVGHSNHELDAFTDLILVAGVAFLVDVRSYPYSRFAPHFNREELQGALAYRGVQYLFLGEELGGRPDDNDHYDADGHALYGPMAARPAFAAAIDRLLLGARDHRLALMCSCGQPQDCHRRLLVGKVLCDRGAELCHIMPDGSWASESTVSVSCPLDQGALDSEPGHGQRLLHALAQRRGGGMRALQLAGERLQPLQRAQRD